MQWLSGAFQEQHHCIRHRPAVALGLQHSVVQMKEDQARDQLGIRARWDQDVQIAEALKRVLPNPQNAGSEATLGKPLALPPVSEFLAFMPVRAVVLDGQPEARHELEHHVDPDPAIAWIRHISRTTAQDERQQLIDLAFEP